MAERIDALTAARRAKVELAKFDSSIKITGVDQVMFNGKFWIVDLSFTMGKQSDKKRLTVHPLTAKIVSISHVPA